MCALLQSEDTMKGYVGVNNGFVHYKKGHMCNSQVVSQSSFHYKSKYSGFCTYFEKFSHFMLLLEKKELESAAATSEGTKMCI